MYGMLKCALRTHLHEPKRNYTELSLFMTSKLMLKYRHGV